jgi:uncharacterized membrane protein YsdA (DUF1294 family)
VFFPLSRIVALLMAAVLCFGILVPMALARHVPALAMFIAIVFIAYLIANVVLWLRMRPRA